MNPNRLECGSGLGSLCAGGGCLSCRHRPVRALRRRGFFAARREPDLLALLDLVALATVCDVMPLTGLNRALVTQGLKVMAGATAGAGGVAGRGADADRPTAMTPASPWGRASMPPDGWARPIWGCGCCCPRTGGGARAGGDAGRVNRQRQQVEAAMLRRP